MILGTEHSLNPVANDQLRARLYVLLLAAILCLASSYLICTHRWLGLVGLVAACPLVILSARPYWIAATLFAFLPFQGVLTDVFSARTPWIAVCKDVLVAWALAAVLVRRVTDSPKRKSAGLEEWLLVITGLAAVYVLVAPTYLSAILALRGIVLYPCITVVTVYCLDSPRDLRSLLRVVAFVGGITIIYGILQHSYNFDQAFRGSLVELSRREFRFHTQAIISTFPGRPDFGGYLVALILLVWQVRLWRMSVLGATLRWLFLGGALFCLFWTYSRTSWVALVVGVCVALALKNKVRATVAVLILSMLFGWFYSAQLTHASRATDIAVTNTGSLGIRLRLWGQTLEMLRSRPFGYGLGTVGGKLLIDSGSPSQPKPQRNVLLVTDNAYLKLLLQGGLLLGVAFLVFFGLMVRLAIIVPKAALDRWLKNVAIWASSSLVALLVMFCTVDYMEATTSIPIYWLAVGTLAWLVSLTRDYYPQRQSRHLN